MEWGWGGDGVGQGWAGVWVGQGWQRGNGRAGS